MGGRDGDPQPVELLLAALVGCEQATAAFAARHMEPRLRLEGIDFAYEAERDPRGATALPLGAPPPAPARLLAVTGVARGRGRGRGGRGGGRRGPTSGGTGAGRGGAAAVPRGPDAPGRGGPTQHQVGAGGGRPVAVPGPQPDGPGLPRRLDGG